MNRASYARWKSQVTELMKSKYGLEPADWWSDDVKGLWLAGWTVKRFVGFYATKYGLEPIKED